MADSFVLEFFNITVADPTSKRAVADNSSILFATLSIGAWALIVILLWWYSKGDDKTWGTPSNIGIMFFALLVTFIADFIVHNGRSMTFDVYMFIKLLGIGIIVCIFGAQKLFVLPPDASVPTIGSHHKSISFIIWLITIPLIILEILQGAAMLADGYKEVFLAMVNCLAILQKLVQGGIYHFHLSRKTPMEGKRYGAIWYFKLMALFNFSQWIQSIIQAETEFGVPGKMMVIKDIYHVLASTYHALMIDYRLLCCLLFLEHAYEIETHHDTDDVNHHERKIQDNFTYHNNISERFYINASRMQKLGIFAGFLLLCSQLVNALVYLKYVGPEVNFLGILAELLVIIQGLLIINQVRAMLLEGGKWRETNSKGVDLMVGLMGVTGLTFWIFKTMLIGTWSLHVSKKYYAFMWNDVKSGCRAMSCLFSIYFYMRTDHMLGCHGRIKFRLRNHFLLPCLMMTYLAVFLNSVVDSYNKTIKKEMKRSLPIILFAVYEAGVPIHLGFCLHLSIHLLLMNGKMRESLKNSLTSYKHTGSSGAMHRDRSPLLKDTDDYNIDYDDADDIFGAKRELTIGFLDDKAKRFRTC